MIKNLLDNLSEIDFEKISDNDTDRVKKIENLESLLIYCLRIMINFKCISYDYRVVKDKLLNIYSTYYKYNNETPYINGLFNKYIILNNKMPLYKKVKYNDDTDCEVFIYKSDKSITIRDYENNVDYNLKPSFGELKLRSFDNDYIVYLTNYLYHYFIIECQTQLEFRDFINNDKVLEVYTLMGVDKCQ